MLPLANRRIAYPRVISVGGSQSSASAVELVESDSPHAEKLAPTNRSTSPRERGGAARGNASAHSVPPQRPGRGPARSTQGWPRWCSRASLAAGAASREQLLFWPLHGPHSRLGSPDVHSYRTASDRVGDHGTGGPTCPRDARGAFLPEHGWRRDVVAV